MESGGLIMKKYLQMILLICILVTLVSCDKTKDTASSSIYVVIEERKQSGANNEIVKLTLEENKKEDIAKFNEIRDIYYNGKQEELIFISEDDNLVSINDDKSLSTIKENVNGVRRINKNIYYYDNSGIYKYDDNESTLLLDESCTMLYDITDEGNILYVNDKNILKIYEDNSIKTLLNEEVELLTKNGDYYEIYTKIYNKTGVSGNIYLYNIMNKELLHISDSSGRIKVINNDKITSVVQYNRLYCKENNIEFTDEGTWEIYNLKTKEKEIITRDIAKYSSVKVDEDNNYYYEDINNNLIKYNLDSKDKVLLKSNIGSLYRWNNKTIYTTGKEIGFVEDNTEKIDDIESSIWGVSIVDDTFSYINTLGELKVNEKVIDTGVNIEGKVEASKDYVVYEKEGYLYYYDINKSKSYKLIEVSDNKIYKVFIEDSFFVIVK